MLVEEETSSDDAKRSKSHGDIFQAALDRLGGMDAANAIVVGDTPYGAQAARNVGLRTIGILCGGYAEHGLLLDVMGSIPRRTRAGSLTGTQNILSSFPSA